MKSKKQSIQEPLQIQEDIIFNVIMDDLEIILNK